MGNYSVSTVRNAKLDTDVVVLTRSGDSPAEVHIAPSFGSNMYRFALEGRELIFCDEATLANGGWTGNFVMWPIPNRVRNKQYTFQGNTYSLKNIDRGEGIGPVIHGLVDNQAFTVVSASNDENAAWVITAIEIVEGHPAFRYFPFPSRLTLRVELSEDAVTTYYTVESLGNTPVPFGFGLHPYFSTFGQLDNTFITVPAERMMQRDEGLVPTKTVLPVAGTQFDVRKPTPVNEVYLDEDYLDLPAGAPLTLAWGSIGKTLLCEASEEFTHCVLYTQQRERFVCLENVTGATDMINLDNDAVEMNDQALRDAAHLLVVPPGGRHEGFIRFRITQD